jgi:hypothetical protein
MDLLHFVDNDEDFQRFLQSREGRRRYPQPEHAGRPRTPFQYVSDHYGIDVRVLRALVEEATERADFFDPLPRAHRPAQWNPEVERVLQMVCAAHPYSGLRANARILQNRLKDAGYKTTYKGKVRYGPNFTTIAKKAREQGFFRALRHRPHLNEKDIAERKLVCPRLLAVDSTTAMDIDEAWLTVKGKGRLVVLPGDSPEMIADMHTNALNKDVHFPKVLMSAALTCPVHMGKDANKRAIFGPGDNGVVWVTRLRGESERKRVKYDKPPSDPSRVIVKGRGDAIYTDMVINGPAYHQIYFSKEGLVDRRDAYVDARPPVDERTSVCVLPVDPDELKERAEAVIKKPPAKFLGRRSGAPAGAHRGPMRLRHVQEDGAPGHGYDNRHAGRPTAIHDKLVDDLRKFDLKLIKQPAHSPETNACDIGFWNILRAQIAEHSDAIPAFIGTNSDQVEAAIWRVAKQAVALIPAYKIFNIFKVKEANLRAIIARDGAKLIMEPHTEIRKYWGTEGDPEDVPNWVDEELEED